MKKSREGRKIMVTSKKQEISRIYGEYLKVVDEIFMAYFDATMGFTMYKDIVERSHKDLIATGKLTRDQANESPFVYGVGNPAESKSYSLIETNASDFKNRNKMDGNNFRILGNMSLVLLYNFWEDEYRLEIAKTVKNSKRKNDVKLDIMKDISNIRNSIIHHKGRANKDTGKNEILNWFRCGEEIFINKDHLKTILFKLREGLNELIEKYA
jgi:hypothetical protein